MPAIHLESLELDDTYIVIKPLKGDMATEKKYDRHGFGEIITGEDNINFFDEKPDKGDYVVYDDSDAVEIPLEIKKGEPPVNVEVVSYEKILAIDHVISIKDKDEREEK